MTFNTEWRKLQDWKPRGMNNEASNGHWSQKQTYHELQTIKISKRHISHFCRQTWIDIDVL